ncbi:hypothetical protein EZV62_013454 [Acer yangbiense]|uniref:MADS-box domain-containing protein n=1 Tax=Acer yangbiense TaxID=1000413 RepID=A0A5C7HY96_9ROSI|nr:hypothetical protein EZV62_013454 [Acer yangbiense]
MLKFAWSALVRTGRVETWPENHSDVLDLIGKFGGSSEKAREKGKQKYNLVGFLGDKKRKLDEKLNKKRKNPEDDESVKNYDPGSVISAWDERLDRFSEEELVGLCSCLDSKLQELRDQIRVIQMKKKEKAPVVELQNPEINSKFERQENLAFLNENYNNNHVGMVNMNNNLGFEDHHFMPSHTSPTHLQLHQQVLPISMRLPLPFSSDQFSCFG